MNANTNAAALMNMSANVNANPSPIPGVPYSWLYIALGFIAMILAAIGSAYYANWDWRAMLNTQVGIPKINAAAVLPVPLAPATTESPSAAAAATKETWCFVGEDLSGRYCVKVPSEIACSSERTFNSRSSCELTPANNMITGAVRNGGIGIQPLSSMHLKD
jgi:hypothetical protein